MVLGNKGSTDQHSYIQQLRDGLLNFFVTFIEVLRDRKENSLQVETNITSGDFLSGFFQGTRKALYESGRESMTITVNEVSPFTVGLLIALFERAVGLYAALVNVNAYHQPGVEAGKKAATEVIRLQLKIQEFLTKRGSESFSADQIAATIGAAEDCETIYKICEHLSANPDRGISKLAADKPGAVKFKKS
jgi:glucose-6-phosphate isomerase